MGGPRIADLATLSTVKDYVGPDDNSDDAMLAKLTGWASDMIRDQTQRVFTHPPTATPEQRAVWFMGTKSVRLDDPLTDITEIIAPLGHTVDGEPYPFVRVLLEEEYEVLTRPTGTTLRLDFPGNGKYLVTGTWGWETIPGSIEYATVVTVDEWYRSNLLPSGGGREEGSGEGKNLFLPREVQEGLEPWSLVEMIS